MANVSCDQSMCFYFMGEAGTRGGCSAYSIAMQGGDDDRANYFATCETYTGRFTRDGKLKDEPDDE